MIKNVIFDLGRVLINWDPVKFGMDYTNDPQLQSKIGTQLFTHRDWHLLDKGEFSEEEHTLRVSERLDLPVEVVRDIIYKGRQTMSLKEETYKELKRLSSSYNLYCISNMSLISWEVVKEQHSFVNYFKDIVISAEVKIIKPEKEIFEYSLKKFKINPEESIFIDDLPENIKSAGSFGISGILFDESDKCWSEIRSL